VEPGWRWTTRGSGGAAVADGDDSFAPGAPESSGHVSDDVGEFSSEFVTFYREEYPQTVRLARLLCGSADVGEDLTQEAFLAISSRFASLDAPATYLRVTVVNLVRRQYRDRRRRNARLQLLPDPGPVSDVYLAADLADVIAALPVRQRVVIVGRYWAGWSEAELAEVLDCRPGTIKSLASRALSTLRDQIGKDNL
jgi:RNA polymerase sigma factor (sigma-70 family)